MKKKKVPEVGKTYKFYDDGKVGPSRRYWAKVKAVIDIDETKGIWVNVPNSDLSPDEDEFLKRSLYNVIIERIKEEDWLYAKEQKEVICAVQFRHTTTMTFGSFVTPKATGSRWTYRIVGSVVYLM